MADIIQLNVISLDGVNDYVELQDGSGNGIDYRVTVVSTREPLLGQVTDTNDVAKDDKALVSIERVAEAFLLFPEITSAKIEGAVITFEGDFDFEFAGSNTGFTGTHVDISGGSKFGWVKGRNSNDGVVYDFYNQPNQPVPSDNYVIQFLENIRIDSVEHRISNFSNYDLRDNIAANFGDLVRTKIFFTSAETLTATDSFKFYYGYIEKDENPYPNVDDFKIDINKFKDPYHDSVTQFTRDKPTVPASFEDMNHVSPKWGQYGNASLYDYDDATNRYAILFEHRVPFMPREDDYDLLNYTIPEEVNGGKSLKTIFQIDIISDKAANSPEQSTTRRDLTNFFDRGSVGYYDQVFQTGEKFYSLSANSLVFNNGTVDVDKIDSSRDTTVTFTIEMDDGSTPFTSTDEIILHIQDVNLVTSESAKRKTFLDNQKYDSVTRNINNTPGGSTRITQFKADIDAVDLWKINCEAVIPKLQVTDFYNLWCSVSRDYNNTMPLMTAQNIYLQSEVAEAGGDESVIYMDFYDTTAVREDFNFFPHWQTNESEISGAFNEVSSFPEDVLACRFRVVNEDAAKTILTSFKVRLKGYNIRGL